MDGYNKFAIDFFFFFEGLLLDPDTRSLGFHHYSCFYFVFSPAFCVIFDSILSELVQNADDAGARTVRVMLNTNQYGNGSLLSPAMSKWQGPSLYVFNDAVFTDRDFQNLARIGQVRFLRCRGRPFSREATRFVAKHSDVLPWYRGILGFVRQFLSL